MAKNPTDKVSWYNMGVLTSKDPNKLAEAEGYFKKSLEIDPNYKDALQGMISVSYTHLDVYKRQILEQYYYAKGLGLLNSGKISEGAEVLAKISELGKSKIYTGKNAEKQKVYYVGKTAADASGISGLKEENYVPTTTGALGNKINPLLTKANDDAMAAYNACLLYTSRCV